MPRDKTPIYPILLQNIKRQTRVDQIFSCLTLMALVKIDVIYIIEDAKEPDIILKTLNIKYKCWLPKLTRRFKDDNLIIVTNR